MKKITKNGSKWLKKYARSLFEREGIERVTIVLEVSWG